MDFKDILSGFAKLGLPILGAALPIPGGAAIGAALAAQIGAPSASPEDLLTTLAASPEARQKAVEFQLTHQEAMLKLATEHERSLYQIEADDRASARKAAVDGGTSDKMFWFAATLVFSTIGVEVAVFFLGYPSGLPDIMAGRIIGYIEALGMAAAAFLLGTTANSARKTELLAQSAPAK